jgi:hypothetical protein
MKPEELNETLTALREARADNSITENGLATLDALEKGSWTSPFVANLLQGVSGNYSDEILGYLRSAFTGADKDITTALERNVVKESMAESPASSMLTQFAGPLLLTRGRPSIGKATGFGALFGSGASEGDFKERAGDAAIGAGTSAASYPVFNLLLKPIETIGSGIKNIVAGPASLGRQQAKELIKEAIANDAKTIDEAFLYILNKNNSGKPLTLADIGTNTQSLLDVVNVLPGEGKGIASNFLRNRDKGLLTRLSTDLTKAFGRDANYFAEFKALQNARSQTGNKLYNLAYKRNIKINNNLETLFKRPSMQQALNKALNIAAEEDVSLPKITLKNGKLVGPKGTRIKSLPTRFFHYVKRGLDDVVFTAGEQGKDFRNTAKNTRIQFLDILDESNPAYKRARNYWSGKSSVMDAMNLGNTFLKANVNELADDIANMSSSELEAFRLGAMQNMLSEIEKGAERTSVQRLLRSPEREKLMRLTFPATADGKKAANTFITNLTDEIIMRDTSKGVLSGSQTAGRSEFASRIKDKAKRIPITGLTELVSRSISKDFLQLEQSQTSEVARELAKILTETNPNNLNNIKRDLANQGIKNVLKNYLPSLLPKFGNFIVNPTALSTAAANIESRSDIVPNPSNLIR